MSACSHREPEASDSLKPSRRTSPLLPNLWLSCSSTLTKPTPTPMLVLRSIFLNLVGACVIGSGMWAVHKRDGKLLYMCAVPTRPVGNRAWLGQDRDWHVIATIQPLAPRAPPQSSLHFPPAPPPRQVARPMPRPVCATSSLSAPSKPLSRSTSSPPPTALATAAP